MSLYFILFFSGVLTILLPCILPLIPVVVGVSIAGRNKWQPLVTCMGMLISFVGSTFVLQVVLSQFVALSEVIRISTYYVLLLFGICFLTTNKNLQILVAVAGGFFFWRWGWTGVTIAEVAGWLAIEAGGSVSSRIQQLGSDVQTATRSEFGAGSLLTALVIGLTLGLVWVPCAGPALGFALALVRDQPGLQAFFALTAYGAGAALPVLIIGYGGQYAVTSARAFTRYSGTIKHVAGALLIISALAFQYNIFQELQTWLVSNTTFGTFGTTLEDRLFGGQMPAVQNSVPEESSSSVLSAGALPQQPSSGAVASPSPTAAREWPPAIAMELPTLLKLTRAPEFTGLGPWHNSTPLTMKELKGKVVLVDFWTYSCINCIRTLPYMQGYWTKFKDMPFVLIGVHTPEFVFEKNENNVEDAIKRHGLTYPVAQDNDFGTWNAFANRYWPAKYLIDADGYIRYTHFGEGGYDETDLAIQSLLKEATGKTAAGPLIGEDASEGGGRDVSPETYVGERNWPSFTNAAGDPDLQVHSYTMPSSVPFNQYALSGDWQLSSDGEYQVLRSPEGEITYRALGGEVNLVLGLEDGVESVQADIFIDGKKAKTITIAPHDLYNLYKGAYGEHDVTLKIHRKGVQVYAYTFGS